MSVWRRSSRNGFTSLDCLIVLSVVVTVTMKPESVCVFRQLNELSACRKSSSPMRDERHFSIHCVRSMSLVSILISLNTMFHSFFYA